jgi:hypothetical protein
MAYQATIYRLVIMCGSDTEEDRKVLPGVVQLWNERYAARHSAYYLPELWRPASERPADAGKTLAQVADILVGVFWTRLDAGVPGDTQAADDAEAFAHGQGRLLFFLLNKPVSPDRLDIEQFRRLSVVRDASKRTGTFETYLGSKELYEKLHAALTAIAAGNAQRTVVPTPPSRLASAAGTEPAGRPPEPAPPSEPARAELPLDEPPVQEKEKGKATLIQHGFDVSAESPGARRTQRTSIGDEDSVILQKEKFKFLVLKYETEWLNERNSEPSGITEGKYILIRMGSDLEKFRAKFVNNVDERIIRKLDEIISSTRGVQKTTLKSDGGKSYKDFWALGDSLIQELKRLMNYL